MDVPHASPYYDVRDKEPSQRIGPLVLRWLYSKFSSMINLDRSNDNFYALMETAISPAKHALFNILGCKFLSLAGYLPPQSPNLSITSCAKVGALGGTVLALWYFFLLIKKWNALQINEENLDTPTGRALVLVKEMACSALCAIIGAHACGFTELPGLGIAGFLGPIIFLVVLFGIFAVAVAATKIVQKFLNQQTI